MTRIRRPLHLPDPTPPTSDAELAAATIEKPQRLDGPVQLSPYDPQWPALYAAEATRIRAALGDQVRLLEHVGSTSIPGIAAKPKIDMVLAVPNSADESRYVPRLEAAGYTLNNREPDWYEHRLLRPPRTQGNLHVFSDDCREIDRMLLFRDWLRGHDDERDLYERTKRELAARTWKYTQNYADAKATVIRAILARALAAQNADG